MLTEGSGVPVGLAIEGANRHDCKMVKATIKSIPVKRPKPTKRKKHGMCLDKGYDSGDHAVSNEVIRDIISAFKKSEKKTKSKKV